MRNWKLLKSCDSEIHVKQIRVNQGVSVVNRLHWHYCVFKPAYLLSCGKHWQKKRETVMCNTTTLYRRTMVWHFHWILFKTPKYNLQAFSNLNWTIFQWGQRGIHSANFEIIFSHKICQDLSIELVSKELNHFGGIALFCQDWAPGTLTGGK